jgi:2-polyprenyl-3-methyl-5-hydroxy-6-metoxy-1,4-benzoquinol methylase
VKNFFYKGSEFKKISFRDPSGFIVSSQNKIYRAIGEKIAPDIKELLCSKWFKELVDAGKIQNSSWVEPILTDDRWAWLEHSKFRFPVYPHEICAEQLYESGLLTLEIAKIAYKNGYVLKDASAWNVVFNNGSPQFIDITSFEKSKHIQLWEAYGQFCRHFVLPLLLYKLLSIPVNTIFLSSLDGIKPIDCQNLLGVRSLMSLCSIETVLLPSLLDNKLFNLKIDNTNSKSSQTKIFLSTLDRLEKYLRSMRPSTSNKVSHWSSYNKNRGHYSITDQKLKLNFVKESLSLMRGPILDLGCNNGEYSLLASSYGFEVVAVDFDEVALNTLQAISKKSTINISNLNIARPTPAVGWENEEYPSFLSKADGYFKSIICLGFIHHLLITERIPLEKIIDLLSQLTSGFLLIEWIHTSDVMFQTMSSRNADFFEFLTQDNFEKNMARKFQLVKEFSYANLKRTLYLYEKI